ncbi:MAG: hypothetical protein V7603_4168 [Micromonosporaceae bacterium]
MRSESERDYISARLPLPLDANVTVSPTTAPWSAGCTRAACAATPSPGTAPAFDPMRHEREEGPRDNAVRPG